MEAARANLWDPSHGSPLAWCDLFEGSALAAQGRFPAAYKLLLAAQTAFRRPGNGRGQAEAALALAHYHAELGALSRAEACVATATALAADDPWLAWRAQVQAADLLVSQTQYARAAQAYARLAPVGQAADWAFDMAHVRLMQGLVAVQQGTFAEAEGHLAAAAAIYRADGSPYYLGVCSRAFASLYRGMGRYTEALAAASEALATFEALGHELAVGRCYHMLALIHHAQNCYAEALDEYRAARARFADAGYRQGVVVMTLNEAIIEEAHGHFDAALSSYERALAEGGRLRLANAAGHCHHRMAILNGRLGRYPEAVTHFRAARRTHTRAGAHFEAQLCAAGQAGALYLLGQKPQARRLLARARRYFAADRRPAPLAFCELTLGQLLAGEGHHRRAQAHYRAALAYFEASGQTIDAALCRLDIGEAHLAAGQAAEAWSLLTAAVAPLGDFPDAAARAEHALGHAAAALGRLADATAHWQRGVMHATRARRGLVIESHAASFFESHRRFYEDALDGWLAAAEPMRALEVVETSKGAVLAGLLQQRDIVNATFRQQTPAMQALWEQIWQVNRELDALRARWPTAPGEGTRLLGLEDAITGGDGVVPARLTQLTAQQAALFERIRRSAARFEVLDPAQPFDLERLRAVAAAACGPDWCGLTYYLRPKNVTVFWLNGSDVRAYTRPLSRLDRAKLSRAVAPDPEQREVTYAGRLRGVPQPYPPGPRLMADLARLLIPDDVLPELDSGRRLLIAPHGLLHYLPFHALRPDGGPPLLTRVTISYAPTLRAWEALATAAMTADSGQELKKALVVGVGDFSGQAPPLACTEAEAQDVAGRLGARAHLFTGRALTCEQLARWGADGTLAGFDVIHLATHALFDGAHPLQSRILLADGGMTVPDLFRLRLNARLVILSACQTALSKLEPGDELLGLREALLFAGARALVVSLWQVDDAVTGHLMAHFYAHLLAGAQPAEALAAAQRTLYQAGEPAFNWAPFVLVG